MGLFCCTFKCLFCLSFAIIKSLVILGTLWVAIYVGWTQLRKLYNKGIGKYGGVVVSDTSSPKAVLITGCDSGFGNQLAVKLFKLNFKVYATVLDIKSDGAQQLKTHIVEESDNQKMHVLKMDVTRDQDIAKVWDYVKKDMDKNGDVLWALVNNAGIMTAGLIEWGTLDHITKMIDVNLMGTIKVTRAFLNFLRKADPRGRVVNVTSYCGRVPFSPLGAYSASKSAAIGFSDALRRELKPFGIMVSTIEPHLTRTGFIDPKEITKQMYDIFDRSSDEVKEAYGSADKTKKFYTEAMDLLPIADMEAVVVDMIDAVIAKWPKIAYRPYSWYFTIIRFIDVVFPAFNDFTFYLFEKLLTV